MIAKVRIAPVERWCKPQLRAARKAKANLKNIAGLPIAIITESMEIAVTCKSRHWKVEPLSSEQFGICTGHLGHSNRWACEHVLEMD